MIARTKINRPLFAAALAAFTSSLTFATTAVSLSSFYGIEEPTVIYYPATSSFVTGDTYPNITDEGGGVFKMELRYNPGTDGTQINWWDGNMSDTTSTDRGRAEVKGLGPHLFPGQTFDFVSTWRTSANFQNTTHFCHIWQGYGVSGESSVAFLAQMTLEGTAGAGKVHLIPGGANTSNPDTLARNFTYVPGTWQTSNIEIYSANTGGYCTLSVNGDTPAGVFNLQTTVNGADSIRPKWGLYRYFQAGWSLGDEYIEHSNVQSNQVSGGTSGDFSIAASPSSQTVTHGSNTTYTVTDTALNGFTGSASLSVSGLPAHATASFNPTAIAGSGSSMLTVVTNRKTPAGTSTLTITGTSGSLTHSTTVTLVVQ
jgi:hypothetical protein